ncbi:diphthine synthase [Candidatus Woesearchaeota archaeon]|nr:diphthine synthase [Candidatus Woesearchaeota archaeon]|tara:strand:+ start:21938 stop:22693 length:756 start_codon:yes stop_codon:yes gene_type:complete
MTLYLIGTGLNDERDITIKGLETIKSCDEVYLENYTSLINCSISDLEKYYGKKITIVDRKFVEQTDELVNSSKTKNIALLVIGDPFGATTHIDLMLRCKKESVGFKIINNASILTAIGITGLQIYKFGKTTSIPFPDKNFRPETSYEVIKQNKILGLHTLVMLDLKPEQDKFMTVSEAINILLEIESRKHQNVFTKETFCVGVARIGSDDFVIKSGIASDLLKEDFGKQPHSLIVPGELHFVEEDALKMWK